MCSMIESRLRLAIQGSCAPFQAHSLNTGKPKITFVRGFGKDRLDMPVLFLDLIHGRVQDELPPVDHQNVVGDLFHLCNLVR